MTTRGRKTMTTKRSTVKKPYGNSRYGNDAFVKIEAIEPLAIPAAANGQFFSTMRVSQSPGGTTTGNVYLTE